MLVECFMVTAPTDKSCREWFQLFKDGDFSVENKPRSVKIRRQRIRDITRRRSESNARRTCRIIGGNSTSRFCCRLKAMRMIQKQENCLMNWNRETLKGDFHLWIADSKTTEKRFFASDCDRIVIGVHRTGDEKWIFYDNPKKKKYYAKSGQSLLSISISIPRPNIHGSKNHALYLVGPKGSCLLWAAETWRFHYGRSVSATINSFEPCIARKMIGIRAKTW